MKVTRIRVREDSGALHRDDVSPVAIDRRDILESGRPHPKACSTPLGDVVTADKTFVYFAPHNCEKLRSGEIEFDHEPSQDELEKAFPGSTARASERARVQAVKAAIASAGRDDGVADLISSGALKASDYDAAEIVAINERLKLRGKTEIKE